MNFTVNYMQYSCLILVVSGMHNKGADLQNLTRGQNMLLPRPGNYLALVWIQISFTPGYPQGQIKLLIVHIKYRFRLLFWRQRQFENHFRSALEQIQVSASSNKSYESKCWLQPISLLAASLCTGSGTKYY